MVVIDLTTRVAKVYHKGHYSMVFGHPSFAKKLHAFAKKLWQLKAGGKKRSDGFFPPSLPNALNPGTPPSLKSYGGGTKLWRTSDFCKRTFYDNAFLVV